MRRIMSRGICIFCGKDFARNVMTRHLSVCEARIAAQQTAPSGSGALRTVSVVQLFVSGGSDYWLHIEVPVDAPMRQIDQFLRDIWLECCGHLSAFRLGGKQAIWAFEVNELSMTRKVKGVFGPDTVIKYEYDFGSTTELKLTYTAERPAAVRGYEVSLLARNTPPVYPCRECREPATQLCTECDWDEDGNWLCESHASTHDCGEEGLLPVVNSPRVGVCGYNGSLIYGDLGLLQP